MHLHCATKPPSTSRTVFTLQSRSSVLISQLLIIFPPNPSPWQLPFYFLSPWIWLLEVPYKRTMSSRLVCIVAGVRISFLIRWNNIPLYVYVIFGFSIHPLMDTWVAFVFWLLWRMLLFTWAQIPLQVPAFTSFRCISRSGIPVTYGDSVFKFLRNHCPVLYRGCTIHTPTKSAQRFQF